MQKLNKIKSYYEPNIVDDLPDYKILGWESEAAQQMRFEVLTSNIILEHKRVLDVGCGLGNLFEYLIGKNIHVEYTGVDILEKMIECAKSKSLKARFHCMDIFDKHSFQKGDFDVVYASGTFNLNLGNNKEFLSKALNLFFELSMETVAFNLLHHKSPEKEDMYFYFKPEEVVEMIEKLPYEINEIRIVEQYLKNDFTVICKK